jgi:hypothetical protein
MQSATRSRPWLDGRVAARATGGLIRNLTRLCSILLL